MADLSAISEWADGLLASLSPAGRKSLAAELAKDLRKSQQQRIAAQQNPDGTAYAPRKPQLRFKKGAIRRKMFSKLRAARFLKMQSRPESAVVEFSSSVQRIAQVHQGGLRDRVARRANAPEVQYARRELLGLTESDISRIREITLNHLSR